VFLGLWAFEQGMGYVRVDHVTPFARSNSAERSALDRGHEDLVIECKPKEVPGWVVGELFQIWEGSWNASDWALRDWN